MEKEHNMPYDYDDTVDRADMIKIVAVGDNGNRRLFIDVKWVQTIGGYRV